MQLSRACVFACYRSTMTIRYSVGSRNIVTIIFLQISSPACFCRRVFLSAFSFGLVHPIKFSRVDWTSSVTVEVWTESVQSHKSSVPIRVGLCSAPLPHREARIFFKKYEPTHTRMKNSGGTPTLHYVKFRSILNSFLLGETKMSTGVETLSPLFFTLLHFNVFCYHFLPLTPATS